MRFDHNAKNDADMNELHLWMTIVAPCFAYFAISRACEARIDGLMSENCTIDAKIKMVTAMMLAAVAFVSPTGMQAAAAILLLCGLIYLAVIDLRHLAIPVWPILPLVVMGVGFGWTEGGWSAAGERIAASVCGWAVLRAVDRAYFRVRGVSGLGSGDALIASVLGAWLSFEGLAWSIALGCSITLVIALIARAPSRRAWPLAPGLAAGACVSMLIRGAL